MIRPRRAGLGSRVSPLTGSLFLKSPVLFSLTGGGSMCNNAIALPECAKHRRRESTLCCSGRCGEMLIWLNEESSGLQSAFFSDKSEFSDGVVIRLDHNQFRFWELVDGPIFATGRTRGLGC